MSTQASLGDDDHHDEHHPYEAGRRGKPGPTSVDECGDQREEQDQRPEHFGAGPRADILLCRMDTGVPRDVAVRSDPGSDASASGARLPPMPSLAVLSVDQR